MRDSLHHDTRPLADVRRRTRAVLAQVPTDLVGVAGFGILALVSLTIVDTTSTVARAAVGFPLLFFAPGYVVVASLFPRAAPARAQREGKPLAIRHAREITEIERGALSFGLSLAVLPLIGLLIAFSPLRFTRTAVVGAVAGFVLFGDGVALVRRFRVSRPHRYRVDLGRRLGTVRSTLFESESRALLAVNVILAGSVVLALATVGYALVSPQQGERYTDLQLLTENESGDLVASGYPSDFVAGESESLTVAVDNHEHEDTDYELVVVVERIDADEGDGTVVERAELDRFTATVEDGETWTRQHEIAPDMIGQDLRISYLLFTDDAPDDPRAADAYRHVYVGVDVWEDTVPDGE